MLIMDMGNFPVLLLNLWRRRFLLVVSSPVCIVGELVLTFDLLLYIDGDRMQGYVNPSGKLVWQGAFVGPDGLATLKVESVTEVKLPSKRTCCEQCNIM